MAPAKLNVLQFRILLVHCFPVLIISAICGVRKKRIQKMWQLKSAQWTLLLH